MDGSRTPSAGCSRPSVTPKPTSKRWWSTTLATLGSPAGSRIGLPSASESSLKAPLGFSAAVNAGIDAAAGDIVVLFDPGVELKGDAVSPLLEALSDPTVMVAGPFGLRASGTMKEFEATQGPEVDAIEGYCMAFRRADAIAIDGFDPRFRFYRIADVEFSFRLRDRGGRAVALAGLPLEKHEHRLWESTEPRERDRLSKRNMYRFLDRWRDRKDLLVGQ